METLDSDAIENCTPDLVFKNGYSFGTPIRYAMGGILFLCFFLILSGGNGLIVGPILAIMASYILTSTYGTEVSLENKYVRNYTSSYGIKKGKWKSTLMLPDISILKMGNSVAFNQIYGPGSVRLDDHVYEIYLLSANHRKRILLKTCASGKNAFIAAEELSLKLEKNLVPFNPKISKATLRKRYERH